jgi:small subunit ribosomal protein S6
VSAAEHVHEAAQIPSLLRPASRSRKDQRRWAVQERVYETTVVFDGVLSEDALKKEVAGVKALLESEKAVVHRVDEWGRRELAYRIRKRKSGYYVLFVHGGAGDIPQKVARVLRLNEKVLRFLTVAASPAAIAPKPSPVTTPPAEAQAPAAAVAPVAPPDTART